MPLAPVGLGGQFVGQGFLLDVAMLAGQGDGLVVQFHGQRFPAEDALPFSFHQMELV
ncbi:MAG: hypothetical protein M0C28_24640 [Candidatus Moduliflexus flocculans]|nr:hypothetical protein [Candidatus Moduliflexus flocculans]